MNYSIIVCVNGNFTVHTEHGTDLQAAKVEFHSYCAALWGAADVQKAEVKIVDEQLDCVDGYAEFIRH